MKISSLRNFVRKGQDTDNFIITGWIVDLCMCMCLCVGAGIGTYIHNVYTHTQNYICFLNVTSKIIRR
jgi:hypothetical protein